MRKIYSEKASHGEPESMEALKKGMVIEPSEANPEKEQYESYMDFGDMSFAEVLDLFTTGSEEESENVEENVEEKAHLESPESDGDRQRRGYSFMAFSLPLEEGETAKVPKCQTATNTLKPIIEEDEEWWKAESMEDLPTFPDWVYEKLPDFLKRVIAVSDTKEMKRNQRDVVLLGALTTLISTLFKTSVSYNKRRYWPNLYLYVVAPAGAGKNSLLDPCQELVSGFDREAVPKPNNFVISGNITGAALLEWLKDNEGVGLIFSAEADELTTSMTGKFADSFSPVLRQAWDNANVGQSRRQHKKERIKVKNPKLTVLLAGTPGSVPRFFSGTENVENGLFSRFAFYCMPGEPKVADDLFEDSRGESKAEKCSKLGEEFLEMWKAYFKEDTYVNVKDWQKHDFPERLQLLLYNAIGKLGQDLAVGLVHRSGLLCTRLAMALSVIRQMENTEAEDNHDVEITDEDYLTAWAISRVLWYHTIFVLHNYLKTENTSEGMETAKVLLDRMRDSFTTSEWLTSTSKMKVPQRTAQRYLSVLKNYGKIKSVSRGNYTKTTS